MKKRGIGVAAGMYGTAVMGGGDKSMAIIVMRPDGGADLLLGSVDLGQGSTTVLAQMAAHELGIPYECISVQGMDTAVGPFCAGTWGSRLTYVAGNAVVAAAREARQCLLEAAAVLLKTSADELDISEGTIVSRITSEVSMPVAEAVFKSPLIAGRGSYAPPMRLPDFTTGKGNCFHALSWGAVIAEVEVDTETGEVTLLRMVCTYDAGRAVNPMLVEGQIQGGAIMAQGQAMMEQLYPCYPTVDLQPQTFHDYIIPTAMDIPDIICCIHECPSAEGPYGVKGIGEITAVVPHPAIAEAICNAIGVRIDEIPITPEKILQALYR